MFFQPYLIKLLADGFISYVTHAVCKLSVWGLSLTQNQLMHLQLRSEACVFSISRSDRVSKYYHQELHWLRVAQFIQFHVACVMS